ncbi:MAG TPA: cytochrome c peroxidase [Archangium sp.]|nr:cytochrome c peroxidase [Archangium sp.]
MEIDACHGWRKGLLLAVTTVGLACHVEGQDEAPGDSLSRVFQAQEAGPDLRPLSSIPVPRMTGSDIIDPEAAIVLGKAFFWDIQVGSDGQTACASCHFHAGADNRRQHTIHPGPNGTFEVVSGVEQLL